MDNATLQILKDLAPGAEVQLFSDAMAVQIGKTGSFIVALATGLTSIYFLLGSLGVLGSAKRSMISIALFIVAGVVAFFMYQKSESFSVIDAKNPIIALSPKSLDYDVRKNGWSIAWSHITSIELHEETFQKKQSVAQTTYEIRVNTKLNAAINWKYEAADNNDIAVAKKLQETSGYLVINPEPLGLSHDILQKALEKYRAGL